MCGYIFFNMTIIYISIICQSCSWTPWGSSTLGWESLVSVMPRIIIMWVENPFIADLINILLPTTAQTYSNIMSGRVPVLLGSNTEETLLDLSYDFPWWHRQTAGREAWRAVGAPRAVGNECPVSASRAVVRVMKWC